MPPVLFKNIMNKTQQLALIRNLNFVRSYKLIEDLSTLSEDHLQAAVCSLLDHYKVLYYAVPNGASKSKTMRATFKYTGLISGVPDLMICQMTRNFGGLYLELKHNKNVLSPNQKSFIKQLEDHGYQCEVIRTLQQAKETIFAYLNL